MRTGGFALLLLGTMSFLYPLFGRRLIVTSVFGEYEKPAAIAALAVGAILFGLSFRSRKKDEKK